MRDASHRARRIRLVSVTAGLLLVALSIASAFTYRSADGGATAFAFRWLSLPFLMLWLIVAFRTEALGRSAFQRVISAAILTVFLCSIGSGWLMWLNVAVGDQRDVVISGIVIGKSSGGHRGANTVTVRDQRTMVPVRVEVSRAEYVTVRPGDRFESSMRIGLLGIMYAPAR
jgi:hypothetical protein